METLHSDIPQSVSGMFDIPFENWKTNLTWDPDLRLRLLFDISTPSAEEDNKTAIAVGVSIAVVVVVVGVITALIIIKRCDHTLFQSFVKTFLTKSCASNRRQMLAKREDEAMKVSNAMKKMAANGNGNTERSTWTASHTPSNLRNT